MIETPKTIDELEDLVDEMGIPHHQLTSAFRDFIQKIIYEKRLDDVLGEKLEPASKYLIIDTFIAAQKDDHIRSKLNLELAKLADENRQNDTYYSLLRCLRLIYVDKSEWERVAQDTLLFTFFFHLKHIFGNIEPEFVKYFSKTLFYR